MSLRATKSRIIVIPHQQPDTTNGIVIAPAYKLPSSHGRVVSVGPEQKDVTVGSMISFKPFEGVVFWHEDEEFRLIEPEDVLLIDL